MGSGQGSQETGCGATERRGEGSTEEGTAPPSGERGRRRGQRVTRREDPRTEGGSAKQRPPSRDFRAGTRRRGPTQACARRGMGDPTRRLGPSTPGVAGVRWSLPGTAPLALGGGPNHSRRARSSPSRGDKAPSLDEMPWTWPPPPAPAKPPAPARIPDIAEGGDAPCRSPLQVPRAAVPWSSRAAAGVGGPEEAGMSRVAGNWGAPGLLAPRGLKAGGEFWGTTGLRRPR